MKAMRAFKKAAKDKNYFGIPDPLEDEIFLDDMALDNEDDDISVELGKGGNFYRQSAHGGYADS